MTTLAVLFSLAVTVSSALLVTGLVRDRRPSGGPVHDPAEAAFLGGGPGRVVDAALAAMCEDGRILVGGPGIVAVRRAVAHDPVERAVLHAHAAAPNGALHTLRDAVMRHPAVQEIGDGLAARGLLRVPGSHRLQQRWGTTQGVLCLLALPAAFALTVAEWMASDGFVDEGVPFVLKVLPALVAGSVVGLASAAVARSRITRAGRRAAAAFR
ncbi:TIGR04222 domain-containing membrane protein, partial [Streptomyces sp. NPDC002530]